MSSSSEKVVDPWQRSKSFGLLSFTDKREIYLLASSQNVNNMASVTENDDTELRTIDNEDNNHERLDTIPSEDCADDSSNKVVRCPRWKQLNGVFQSSTLHRRIDLDPKIVPNDDLFDARSKSDILDYRLSSHNSHQSPPLYSSVAARRNSCPSNPMVNLKASITTSKRRGILSNTPFPLRYLENEMHCDDEMDTDRNCEKVVGRPDPGERLVPYSLSSTKVPSPSVFNPLTANELMFMFELNPAEHTFHYKYLKEFRVEQCPLFLQHKCQQHRPFTCFHWHFQNQRRRRPIKRRDSTFNYTADLYCSNYDETTGICPDGDECPYLHRTSGDTERRYHLKYYKTGMCVHDTDNKGFCVKNGPHCAFAHGANDLRAPVYDIRDQMAMENHISSLEKSQLHHNGSSLALLASCSSNQIRSPSGGGPPSMSSAAHHGGQSKSVGFLGVGGGLSAFQNCLDRERSMSLVNDDPKWNDTSYVLVHYKTEPCKKPPRLCRQGYACPQYHNNKDKRRSPSLFKYRSTPCPLVKTGDEWGDPVGCEAGSSCQFCHTRTEQQFHPEIYKSSKCNDIQNTSYCPRGPFCAFAHNNVEQDSNYVAQTAANAIVQQNSSSNGNSGSSASSSLGSGCGGGGGGMIDGLMSNVSKNLCLGSASNNQQDQGVGSGGSSWHRHQIPTGGAGITSGGGLARTYSLNVPPTGFGNNGNCGGAPVRSPAATTGGGGVLCDGLLGGINAVLRHPPHSSYNGMGPAPATGGASNGERSSFLRQQSLSSSCSYVSSSISASMNRTVSGGGGDGGVEGGHGFRIGSITPPFEENGISSPLEISSIGGQTYSSPSQTTLAAASSTSSSAGAQKQLKAPPMESSSRIGGDQQELSSTSNPPVSSDGGGGLGWPTLTESSSGAAGTGAPFGRCSMSDTRTTMGLNHSSSPPPPPSSSSSGCFLNDFVRRKQFSVDYGMLESNRQASMLFPTAVNHRSTHNSLGGIGLAAFDNLNLGTSRNDHNETLQSEHGFEVRSATSSGGGGGGESSSSSFLRGATNDGGRLAICGGESPLLLPSMSGSSTSQLFGNSFASVGPVASTIALEGQLDSLQIASPHFASSERLQTRSGGSDHQTVAPQHYDDLFCSPTTSAHKLDNPSPMVDPSSLLNIDLMQQQKRRMLFQEMSRTRSHLASWDEMINRVRMESSSSTAANSNRGGSTKVDHASGGGGCGGPSVDEGGPPSNSTQYMGGGSDDVFGGRVGGRRLGTSAHTHAQINASVDSDEGVGFETVASSSSARRNGADCQRSNTFDFGGGGAGQQSTLTWNRSALDKFIGELLNNDVDGSSSGMHEGSIASPSSAATFSTNNNPSSTIVSTDDDASGMLLQRKHHREQQSTPPAASSSMSSVALS